MPMPDKVEETYGHVKGLLSDDGELQFRWFVANRTAWFEAADMLAAVRDAMLAAHEDGCPWCRTYRLGTDQEVGPCPTRARIQALAAREE
jgi:hypothetical protein